MGGLGLGLAISKAIIESHGGKIYASSKGSGTGATFTIELKTAQEEAPYTFVPVVQRIKRGFPKGGLIFYRALGSSPLNDVDPCRRKVQGMWPVLRENGLSCAGVNRRGYDQRIQIEKSHHRFPFNSARLVPAMRCAKRQHRGRAVVFFEFSWSRVSHPSCGFDEANVTRGGYHDG